MWGLPDTPSAATGGPGATTAALERGVHGAGSPHGDALGGNAMWHCTARVLLPSIIPWKPLINIGARTQLFASAGNVTTAASACTWCMCDALALRGAVSHATRGASAFCLGSRHALVGRNWVRASYPHRHVRGCVHRGECAIVATCRPTRRGCRHRHWRELLGSPGVGTPSLGFASCRLCSDINNNVGSCTNTIVVATWWLRDDYVYLRSLRRPRYDHLRLRRGIGDCISDRLLRRRRRDPPRPTPLCEAPPPPGGPGAKRVACPRVSGAAALGCWCRSLALCPWLCAWAGESAGATHRLALPWPVPKASSCLRSNWAGWSGASPTKCATCCEVDNTDRCGGAYAMLRSSPSCVVARGEAHGSRPTRMVVGAAVAWRAAAEYSGRNVSTKWWPHTSCASSSHVTVTPCGNTTNG